LEIDVGSVLFDFEDDNSHLSHEISTLARQSWWKSSTHTSPDENLWYTPMDLSNANDRALYLSARKNAWLSLYPSEQSFDGKTFLSDAKSSQKVDPKFVLHTMCRNEKIGILQMNPKYEPSLQAGYISFLYMDPAHRCKGLGVQLLGQAISTYRPMGKNRLHLACSPKNLTAQHFYARNGFRKISETKGAFGPLDLMEKLIQ
ncbi:MAG: GNAT family N-acetyltransferase, partial [Evtepia sp.]